MATKKQSKRISSELNANELATMLSTTVRLLAALGACRIVRAVNKSGDVVAYRIVLPADKWNEDITLKGENNA